MTAHAKRVHANSSREARLGSEHSDCDRIQTIMILLFFAVWSTDALILNYSTFLVRFVPILFRMSLAAISLAAGGFLLLESHTEVFSKADDPPRLLDSGVYSRVRHPMYLGTIVLCIGFFFAVPSVFSLAVVMLFFVLYDKMATYEEKDLIRKVGDEYSEYQKRVPKWLPRIRTKE